MDQTIEIRYSERFEAAFNRIHKKLQELLTHLPSDRFTLLLREGQKKYALVRTYADELYQYAKLRNALVHEKITTGYYIAEPHKQVVERIEDISRRFERPLYALQIATKPVLHFYEETPLSDILNAINTYAYSRFPIYNADGTYQWLLTSNCIVRWMARKLIGSQIDVNAVNACDLKATEKTFTVMFSAKSLDIFEMEDIFEKAHLEGIKLEAVIITENGNASEKPLGIVTSWDLVEIDAMER
jgi:CBS domain-containing protein